MDVSAFIFDLDGVLTDTAELQYRAWKWLAEDLGIPFTREDNAHLRGVSRQESLRRLLGEHRVSPGHFEMLLARKNSYYIDLISNLSASDVLPGAEAFLDEVAAASLPIAVASSSRNARHVLGALGLTARFDVICDGYSVERTKPAPDLFLYTAVRLGVAKTGCVVLEDSLAGVRAAKAAQMYAVGIGPSRHLAEADVIFPSLEGLTLAAVVKARRPLYKAPP